MTINFVSLKVKKLFIFFTDGKNTDREEDLTVYTEKIKKIPGMTAIAVGVGSGDDIDHNELETIASNAKYVFKKEEFEDLKHIIKDLIPCQADELP